MRREVGWPPLEAKIMTFSRSRRLARLLETAALLFWAWGRAALLSILWPGSAMEIPTSVSSQLSLFVSLGSISGAFFSWPSPPGHLPLPPGFSLLDPVSTVSTWKGQILIQLKHRPSSNIYIILSLLLTTHSDSLLMFRPCLSLRHGLNSVCVGSIKGFTICLTRTLRSRGSHIFCHFLRKVLLVILADCFRFGHGSNWFKLLPIIFCVPVGLLFEKTFKFFLNRSALLLALVLVELQNTCKKSWTEKRLNNPTYAVFLKSWGFKDVK